MAAHLDPAAAGALIAEGRKTAAAVRSLGDLHMLRTPTRSLGTFDVASVMAALLDGYEQALAEIDRLRSENAALHVTQDRLVARIAATEAPKDIEETLASLEVARAKIATMETEIDRLRTGIREQLESARDLGEDLCGYGVARNLSALLGDP